MVNHALDWNLFHLVVLAFDSPVVGHGPVDFAPIFSGNLQIERHGLRVTLGWVARNNTLAPALASVNDWRKRGVHGIHALFAVKACRVVRVNHPLRNINGLVRLRVQCPQVSRVVYQKLLFVFREPHFIGDLAKDEGGLFLLPGLLVLILLHTERLFAHLQATLSAVVLLLAPVIVIGQAKALTKSRC